MKAILSILCIWTAFCFCSASDESTLKLPLNIQHRQTEIRYAGGRGANRHLSDMIRVELKTKNSASMDTILLLGAQKVPVLFLVDSGSGQFNFQGRECQRSVDLNTKCTEATTPYVYGYLDGLIVGRLGTGLQVWLSDTLASSGHDYMVIDHNTGTVNESTVGLAKPPGNSPGFIGTLIRNKLISAWAFSIFNDPASGKHFLILGGLQRELLSPGANIVKLVTMAPGVYAIQSDKIALGLLEVLDKPEVTLVDSGNTLISFPKDYAQKMIDYLGQRNIHCFLLRESTPEFENLFCQVPGDESDFPDLRVTYSGKSFKVVGKQLVDHCSLAGVQILYQPANPEALQETKPLLQCRIKIEFQTSGSRMIILGKAFISNVYTTFNLDEGSVTFAQNN